MHHSLRERATSRTHWFLVTALLVACSSSSDTGSTNTGVNTGGTAATSAGTTAAAGKSAAGTMATAGTRATAGVGVPAAGSGVLPTAGHAGALAAGTGAKDEDGGVLPDAGATAGSSGSAGVSGRAGGGAGAVSAGRGGTSAAAGSGGNSAAAATFTQVYALFKTGCAGGADCHVDGTRPGSGLSMVDQATAYTNLVNVDSQQCTGEKRVVPNDIDKSELVHALQHTRIGSCTRTPMMPEGKPMFSAADLAIVTGWVQAGAPNN